MNFAVLILSLAALATLTHALSDSAGCNFDRVSGTYKTFRGVSRNDYKYIAWGHFDDTLENNGFGTFHVHTSTQTVNNATDIDRVSCAGLIEGVLTAERISQAYMIYKKNLLSDFDGNRTDYPSTIQDYINSNMKYTRKMMANTNDPWWNQVNLIVTQTDAILEGYNREKQKSWPGINPTDWWIYQAAGDMDDISIFAMLVSRKQKASATAPTSSLNLPFSDDWYDTHSHCSGLVAAKPDWSDLFTSHVTWTQLNDMNRVAKDYDFKLLANSFHYTFSSNPGTPYSKDDFWSTSNNLVVIETTLHNWNNDLYEKYCVPQSVLCWVRVQVANRISSNGRDWCNNFIKENSGTYNNQYFVVDYKKFTPGKQPTSDLLWAIEQLPGNYHMGDRTQELASNRYVPSFNTPFYTDIFNLAKYPEKIKECNNDYWTYWKNARMQILQRDINKIVDYQTFQSFMRYNDYKNDPLSNTDPAEQIMSRYDLRPDSCIQLGNSKMCPNAFGGTDAKTTNYQLVQQMKFDFISSPQYETQPVWQFGVGKWANITYTGLPKTWNFPWTTFGPQN